MGGIKSAMRKRFDTEPVFKTEKYLKIKTKSYDGKTNTNFHDYSVPKEGSNCVCLSVPLIESIFMMGKNNSLQVFLKDCKYLVKENTMTKFIDDELKISSEDSEEVSDEKTSNKEQVKTKYYDKAFGNS